MRILAALCVIAFASVACLAGGRPTTGGPEAKKTNAVAATTVPADAPIPQSVFIVPTSPKQGRNPFFPNSVPRVPQKTNAPVDFASIVLNGITSPPRRTAMINGSTFEVGETGDVKLSNGSRLTIQCLEIRSDTAIVAISGQKRELHLRSGL